MSYLVGNPEDRFSCVTAHFIVLSDVGSSQVLLADVPGVFSWGSSVFAPPTCWPVSCELK